MARLPSDPPEAQLHGVDRPFAKAAFAVTEIKLPGAQERLIKAQRRNLLPLLAQLVAPAAQGLRVVRAQVLQAIQLQAGLLPHVAQQELHGRQETARKDMLLDEIHVPGRLVEALLRHGDGL